MAEAEGRELAREVTQGDAEAARRYVNALVRAGNLDALAETLAGVSLLRDKLLLHSAESFAFWPQGGEEYKLTVSQAHSGGEGWTLLRHYGDVPVQGDHRFSSELHPQLATQILIQNWPSREYRWRRWDSEDDEWSLVELPLWEAVDLALEICAESVIPSETKEEE